MSGAPRPVALVTGGGTGIGRAIACVLAADGFDVAVAGRRVAPLEAVSAVTGGRAYGCDIASTPQIDGLVERLLDDFGRLDVLVNNASIDTATPIADTSPSEIERVIGINLIGTVLVTQRCLPALRESHGSIINISSTMTHAPQPDHGAYIASKGGVEAFSRAMALELAPDGVRVNVVCPALVRTDMMMFAHGMDREQFERTLRERAASHYPLGRVGEPEDIAGLVAYLASPRAPWITGQTILADGGRVLGGPATTSRHVADVWHLPTPEVDPSGPTP